MTAFRHAAVIEASLERLGEVCPDPAPLVYARLFAARPEIEPQFWRDTSGTIRGEMLARVFEAILDFVGERKYAQHLIAAEMITHEGYEVRPEVFVSFFRLVAEAAEEALGPEWTPAFAAAWGELVAEIEAYAREKA